VRGEVEKEAHNSRRGNASPLQPHKRNGVSVERWGERERERREGMKERRDREKQSRV
jgi:hypothetical protein